MHRLRRIHADQAHFFFAIAIIDDDGVAVHYAYHLKERPLLRQYRGGGGIVLRLLLRVKQVGRDDPGNQ
ncbi:hypothetical protein SDC9_148916 [bioreactor metagenome]|uniref:Uncharacterized protein n=1 Tax=bioreactor metagenome TaxID=1076179 RepID=A0A645EI76_9ZZZZ